MPNAIDPRTPSTPESGGAGDRAATLMILLILQHVSVARAYLEQGRTEMAARQLDDLLKFCGGIMPGQPNGDAA
jgi:hypothetical protein